MALVLGFAGIFLLCLLFLFFRARIRERHGPLLPAPAPGPDAAVAVRAACLLTPRSQGERDDPETVAVLKLYPILKEIPYASIPDGVTPTPQENYTDPAKETMARLIQDSAPVQASSGRLLNLLRNPESNPAEITTIVSTNPVFSARLLRAVNSVYYNLPRKITSIGRAITLLGYNNVRSLVLQEALNAMFPGDNLASGLHGQIWTHSAVTSACSAYLGKRIFGFSEYEMATMGLLHDIGKYYMGNPDPGSDADRETPFPLREERAYGFTHAFLGSLIAKRWDLPELVSRSIAHHHDPSFHHPLNLPEDCAKQSFIICLSDLLAHLFDYDRQPEWVLPIRKEYFAAFGISDDLTALVTPVLAREAHKARSIVESYTNPTAD